MHRLEPCGVVCPAFQLGADESLITGKDEVQIRMGRKSGKGSFNIGIGAVVAAETVYYNLDHFRCFT